MGGTLRAAHSFHADELSLVKLSVGSLWQYVPNSSAVMEKQTSPSEQSDGRAMSQNGKASNVEQTEKGEIEEQDQGVPPKDIEHEQAPEIKFRSRKRSKSVRKRRVLEDAVEEKPGSEGGDEEKDMKQSDILLIKEAQMLRERSRAASLDIHAVKQQTLREKSKKSVASKDDDVIGGLQSDFAVERSGHAMEERMSKFVEERMREKFGDRRDDGEETMTEAKGNEEQDLLEIPERLQVKERPLYDPGAGLPAAGVEEVELSEEAKRKNIEDTVRAHRELLEKKAARVPVQGTAAMSGNLSANFAKHRADWMVDNVGVRTSERAGADCKQETGGGPARDSHGRNDGERVGNPRKRYQGATDGLIADRFRKRWRK